MKKLFIATAMTLLVQTNAHAILAGGPDQCMGLMGVSSSCMFLMTTTSLPTLLIQGEKLDYNSKEGKAFLIQEATNVLDGKKSLVIKNDSEDKVDGKTAVEKAQAILDSLK